MTAFDVTENPSQIYLGQQPSATLVNDGPNTIYFDAIPGVDDINGFELAPTGQMTWKSESNFWARTRAIPGQATKARLKTLTTGELSLTTRAKFYKELYRTNVPANVGYTTPKLETGHCNTVIVRREDSLATGVELTINATWFDETLTAILVETIIVYIGATQQAAESPHYLLRLPVKGKYLTLVETAGTSTAGALRIVGTDAALPSRVDGGCGGATTASTTYDGHQIVLQTWSANNLSFPQNGMYTGFSLTNTGGVPAVVNFTDNSGFILEVWTVAVGTTFYIERRLPINQSHVLRLTAGAIATAVIRWPAEIIAS